ncbi:MAG: lipid-binding SYLF domain-containing protein [Acidobacteriota bacterium]
MKVLSTIVFLISLMTTSTFAGVFSHKNETDLRDRSQDAAAVLSEVLATPEHGIPEALLDKATAIAVIPHVVKGAFFVGGSYGKGLISQRTAHGWSAPAYVSLEGGSFGFQFGASATDFVLVFTNREGLEPLLSGKLTLGADASIAAGPVGRTADASTDVTLSSAIYSYSRSKGVFAGVSLNGAVLSIDNDADHQAYNGHYTGRDILLKGEVSPNRETRPFLEELDKVAA